MRNLKNVKDIFAIIAVKHAILLCRILIHAPRELKALLHACTMRKVGIAHQLVVDLDWCFGALPQFAELGSPLANPNAWHTFIKSYPHQFRIIIKQAEWCKHKSSAQVATKDDKDADLVSCPQCSKLFTSSALIGHLAKTQQQLKRIKHTTHKNKQVAQAQKYNIV